MKRTKRLSNSHT